MFDVVKKLGKNADTDKYKCSGYAIGLNRHGTWIWLMDLIEMQ